MSKQNTIRELILANLPTPDIVQAEANIARMLELPWDLFLKLLDKSAMKETLAVAGLTKDAIKERYWESDWVKQLISMLKEEIVSGNKDARIFAGELVWRTNIQPPRWLIETWLDADLGLLREPSGRRSDAYVKFKDKIAVCLLYAVAQRYRRSVKLEGTTEYLVSDYINLGKKGSDKRLEASTVAKYRKEGERTFSGCLSATSTDSSDHQLIFPTLPDSLIGKLSELLMLDLNDFRNYLGQKHR